jgi:uncharacterized protein YbgA (DUF1722 family)/uncharacterized protein YbbK (DUF523 family)
LSRTFLKPVVVISKCLEFEACRYNGAKISFGLLGRMQPYIDFLPVCPEVEIGLGTPRDPIRLVADGEGHQLLVQPSTGKNLTAKMQGFARGYLNSVKSIDGFILKAKSPSCGIRDAKVFKTADESYSLGKGPGIFTSEVLERFGGQAVEDEGRLNNFTLREHFLTKLFSLAVFRKLKNSLSMQALIRYQSENKLLLMAYNQAALRDMGRIIANHANKTLEKVASTYEEQLHRALARPAKRLSNINVLMHAMGYFSKQLKVSEKSFFLDALERYRARKIPLSVPLQILRAWIVRFESEYLKNQTYFEPYPEDLMEISDSGKGRDL